MSVTKSQKEIDEFVSDIRKTKGGVTVEEEGDDIVVRTRDGDVHSFKVSKARKEG